MSIRHFCLAFLLGFGFVLLSNGPLHAQTPSIQLWHIAFSDEDDLNRLAGELDVWEVDHAAQTLLAPLTPQEAAAIGQSHTLTLAADQSPLDPPVVSLSQVAGIPGYECYRTVDETFATLDQLALDYPQLVAKVDIGDSWDKGEAGGPAGDELRVLVITNQATPGPKFRFMLMGAIHAREYTTAELALRFAETLLQGYGVDPNATWLLDHGELHLLTLANPDGRRIAETGQLWRKNTHADAACTISLPSQSYGVDLNRNSTFKWAECDGFSCSSSNSCTETFRGDAAGSEPEVAAIETYLRTLFADQRGPTLEESAPATTSGLFISLHSYGRLVLFPWGWTTTHAPNGQGLATVARRLGYPLNYTVCQAGGAGCLYQTDGTTDDYAYGDLGVAAFTIELGTSFFQSCTNFESIILQPGLAALRYAFTAAPLPYQLAQGPEVLNSTAMPKEIGTATHVAITATADATHIAPLSGSGNAEIFEAIDRIQGARVVIDTLPWKDATYSYPFAAADSSFNTVQESITANIEMACLPSGRHTLYLQAQDDQEEWGVVAAQFVTVTNSSPFTATIALDRATTVEGRSITYTVSLTNTDSTTSSYTLDSFNLTSGIANITVVPSLPITLAAGASIQLTVVVTPQNNTAGTLVPTVLNIRSLIDASTCRQVRFATDVDSWNYHQRLIILRKN